MYSKEFRAFKERHGIKSADEWARVTEVSKSTIVRGLNGEGKDMGINTILELITPYGETLDQFLSIGEYSPENIEKNKIVEKIENVIDELENSPTIPEETAQEIKGTLEVAQQHIENETKTNEKCPECNALYRIISYLEEDKASKNRWIINLFRTLIIQFIIMGLIISVDTIVIVMLLKK